MPTTIESLASTLVDAFTDGGYCTGWEKLTGISDILRGATTVDEFGSRLRDEPLSRWQEWAETLTVAPPSSDDIEAIVAEVSDILAPLAGLPVTVVIEHTVKRDRSSRRFVEGAPRRVSERDADQIAFIAALLRDGFRFDVTHAEWVSADGNIIGRMSWDDDAVWLRQPLPVTERLRYTRRVSN
jgi:hypothetical protein